MSPAEKYALATRAQFGVIRKSRRNIRKDPGYDTEWPCRLRGKGRAKRGCAVVGASLQSEGTTALEKAVRFAIGPVLARALPVGGPSAGVRLWRDSGSPVQTTASTIMTGGTYDAAV